MRKILRMMVANPFITIPAMCEMLSRAEVTTKKNISLLKKQGYIRRVGGNKGGHWEVLKDDTL